MRRQQDGHHRHEHKDSSFAPPDPVDGEKAGERRTTLPPTHVTSTAKLAMPRETGRLALASGTMLSMTTTKMTTNAGAARWDALRYAGVPSVRLARPRRRNQRLLAAGSPSRIMRRSLSTLGSKP